MNTTVGNPGPNESDSTVARPLSEVQHAEDILRAWLLTYTVNAVGRPAPLRSLELAHDALATLTAAAKGGR